MARPKSKFLSALGTMFAITKAVTDEVLAQGGSDEDLRRILTNRALRQAIARLILGRAEIKPLEHLIDLAAVPFVPSGWVVVEHQKGGQWNWDPAKVQLYLSEKQKGNKCIKGDQLQEELKDKPVLNANVLDFLLKHPHLIPEDWKGKQVFFWGTIYRCPDGNLYVRYLNWYGHAWNWNYIWLGNDWNSDRPAVVSAS